MRTNKLKQFFAFYLSVKNCSVQEISKSDLNVLSQFKLKLLFDDDIIPVIFLQWNCLKI